MRGRVGQIAQIVGTDAGRNISRLVQHTTGQLYAAAQSIARHPCPRVAVCTGFFIPQASIPAAETDGPVGAALLAAALQRNDVPVRVSTDQHCRSAVSAALRATLSQLAVDVYDPVEKATLEGEPFTHFISIERAGPSRTGQIFNMTARDITAETPDFSDAFLRAQTRIGIGDGGNELGMGSIPYDLIAADIHNGAQIACVTPCDYLIVAGVSNWGAWGLLAALKLLREDWTISPFLEAELAERVLTACVQEGPAVDGITLQQSPTVDGLSWDKHREILNRIRAVCGL